MSVTRNPILILKLAPPPLRQAAPKPVIAPPPRARGHAAPKVDPARAPQPAPSMIVPEADPIAQTPPPAQRSTEQMLSIAKRDLGKIDQQLRKEHKGRFSAADESPHNRLEKIFEQAHAAAPNKWYQAARVEDITPPGDDARKIYRITTALGSYCVRYADKNRSDHGQANPGAPLIGACPHAF